MLILSRSEQQAIICTTASGEQIEIRVTAIQDHHVRIGVAAPRSVRINREEVEERIAWENRGRVAR